MNAESQHVVEFELNPVKEEYRRQRKREFLPTDDQSDVVAIDDDENENDEGEDEGLSNDSEVDDDVMSDHSQQKENDGNDDVDMNDEFIANCTKANSLLFFRLCRRFEILYNQRSKQTNKQTKQTLISCLLPDEMYQFLNGSSFFPLLRLILPDLDTTRPHTGMKERTIAVAWADALGFKRQSRPYQKLLHFNDPTVAGPTAAGDLSLAVFETVKERYSDQPSTVTIGQINDLLDELVTIKNPLRSSHHWRSSSQAGGSRSSPKIKNKFGLRRQWAEKIIDKGLSPLEQKWLVRILLQKLDIGIGSKTILHYWRKYALELYQGNNNLKDVCTLLCDPSYIKSMQTNEDHINQANRRTYMEASIIKAVLGNTISPMLSNKVLFSTAMKDLTDVHRNAVKDFSKDNPKRSFLPIVHPCFIAEVKLDGERMVCHVKQGIVTMQTRKAVWYSKLYCPSLGPAIRKALAKWEVNVVLDGEILSWDNGKKENIPFGTNRTVAQARQSWMENEGLLDKRDLNLHAGESDKNTIPAWGHQGIKSDSRIGSNCWLKYVLFDIIYVDGPGAHELMARSLGCDIEAVSTGSIVHLSCFERKKILFLLLDPVEDQVEHVPSLVIRPDGKTARADEYFSSTNPLMDAGYPVSMVDFVKVIFTDDGTILDRAILNEQLRCGHSDAELSLRRTEALDLFYSDIVISQGLEGLIIKDLNSEYLIDKRYQWFKHKPDFENFSNISDVDLVVIGGFFGTGLGPSTFLNSFLLGCVDPENPETYFSFCKINGGGTTRSIMEHALNDTGYQRQTVDREYSAGKWYREKDHDQHKNYPDFMTTRSLQSKGTHEKLAMSSKTYPDLWIHPEDSIILTVKAAEIIESTSFTAGITLRFPRITRVRKKNSADDKPSRHVEPIDGLHQRYREMMQIREVSGKTAFQSGSPVKCGGVKTERRFLTVEEATIKKTTKGRKHRINDTIAWKMPVVGRNESSALVGLSFVVLEGTYGVKEMDSEEARQMGWWDKVKGIKSREDVMRFILAHGGSLMHTAEKSTNFVLGGSPDDARVVKHYEGLDAAINERRIARTRRGLTVDEMVLIGGVLKWNFIASIVNKFIKAVKVQVKSEENTQTLFPGEASIQKTHAYLLKPSRHDYLCASAIATDDDDTVYGISLKEEMTLVTFKRSLLEVQRVGDTVKRMKCRNKSEMKSWQTAAMQFPPEHRWVFGTPLTKFWPWKHNSIEPAVKVVVYPDIFGEDLGSQVENDDDLDRWDRVTTDVRSISACLPLMRVMEANVSAHLHFGVTMVLCDLIGAASMMFGDFDVSKFVDQKRARCLRTRLSTLHPDGACHVHFISPAWVKDSYY